MSSQDVIVATQDVINSLVVLEPRLVAWIEREHTRRDKANASEENECLYTSTCAIGERSSAWNFTWQGTH